MTTMTLRRAAAALAALATLTAALVAFPPDAGAAPSVRQHLVSSAVTDMEVPTPSGLAVVDVNLGGSRGAVALWDDGRTEQLAFTGDDFLVNVSSSTVTGTGPLYDVVTGAPVAEVSFVLHVTRGGTEVFRYRKSIGNQAEIEFNTVTTLSVTGSLELLGQSFPIQGEGQEVIFDIFYNAPASDVGRDAYGTMLAEVHGPAGTLILTAERDWFAAVALNPDGETTTVALTPYDTTVLGSDGMHGTLLVDDLSGGEPVVRRVDVPGRLENDRVRTVEQRPNGDVNITRQSLTLHGVLELAPGLAFDLEGVQATWEQTRWVYKRG